MSEANLDLNIGDTNSVRIFKNYIKGKKSTKKYITSTESCKVLYYQIHRNYNL